MCLPCRWALDYFAMPRGLLQPKPVAVGGGLGAAGHGGSGPVEVPSFAFGRPGYDNWLVRHVVARGIPVVDATQVSLTYLLRISRTHAYPGCPIRTSGVVPYVPRACVDPFRRCQKDTRRAGATHRWWLQDTRAAECLSLCRGISATYAGSLCAVSTHQGSRHTGLSSQAGCSHYRTAHGPTHS